MPWTAADADEHIKGLTAKQRRTWAAVANAALERCEADGGSDCDGSAIRQANAAAKKAKSEAAFGEAATIRGRARALARDLDLILADKGLSDEARAPIAAMRSGLARTWGQILATEADDPEAGDERFVARCVLEAALVLAQDDSFDGRRMLVQQALMQQVASSSANGSPYGYGYDAGPLPYIEEMYDDTVVYCIGGCLYACTYAIDADDAVAFGEPTEVERAYVAAEPAAAAATADDAGDGGVAAEADQALGPPKRKKRAGKKPYRHAAYKEARTGEISSDLVPLVEAGVRSDGTVSIKIIRPGWGSSGYYPAAVLERDGPTVFPRGTHMYLDHPTIEEDLARPERSLKDLAAVLETDPVYRADHPDGPGLYADARVFEPFRDLIGELAPYIGTSIRAQGKTAEGKAEGRTGPVVEQLIQGLSVDFVTAAGAGGKVLEIVEARRARPGRPMAPAPAAAAGPRADPVAAGRPASSQGGTVVTEAEAQALREQSERTAAELTETRARLARMEEAQLIRQALDIAASTLAPIRMADMTRERLLATIAVNPPIAEADGVRTIDRAAFVAAIKEGAAVELEYLARATGHGAGTVSGLGGPAAAEATEADADRAVEAAFSSFLGESLGKIAAAGRR